MQTGIPVDIWAGCGRGPAACPGGLPDAAAARAGGLVVRHGRRGVGARSGALDRFGESWPEMRRKPGTATGFRALFAGNPVTVPGFAPRDTLYALFAAFRRVPITHATVTLKPFRSDSHRISGAVCRKSGDCTRVCPPGYALRVVRCLSPGAHNACYGNSETLPI